jgi:hypothetical protein
MAKSTNGTMGKAAAVYRKKYDEFPANDFPCMVYGSDWKTRVVELFPDFGRKKESA